MALAIARTLAAGHPQAMVPCPLCATSVRAANLERHVGRSHAARVADDDAAGPWSDRRGLSAARLTVEGDHVVLRGRLGVGARRVALVGRVELGGLTPSRPRSFMSSYDDHSGLSDSADELVGVYLRLRGATVGCAASTDVRKHWTGWKQGPPRRGCDIALAPEAFVQLQYTLAERGLLALRGGP